MENKESLKGYIDNLSNEQVELLTSIVCGNINKRLMMQTVYTPEQLNKVDSAYPCGFQNEIIKVIGGENCPNFVYDYNQNNFGQLVNIDRQFISKLNTFFQ
jgi:hypothetical protein